MLLLCFVFLDVIIYEIGFLVILGNDSNFLEIGGVYVIFFVMMIKDGYILVWELFVFKLGFICL